MNSEQILTTLTTISLLALVCVIFLLAFVWQSLNFIKQDIKDVQKELKMLDDKIHKQNLDIQDVRYKK